MNSFLRLLVAWVTVWLVLAWPGGASALDVDSRMSGAWYDPTHSGEGWVVEVLPGNRAVVYWFTYPAPGEAGEQAWILGIGHVDGDRIVITETLITRGPAFGPDYDPGSLEREAWGGWVMTFEDCDSGSVTYEGAEGFGSGDFNIERLSRLAGSGCGNPAKADATDAGFSGSWYEPATDGQGITLEVLPDNAALVYWFTYTPAGDQAWVFGVGSVDDTRFEFPEIFMPVGTVFGETFDPTAVQLRPWGSLSLSFDTCGVGVMNYRSDIEGWGSGWLPLEPLTTLDGHACELPPAPTLNRGSWAASLNMSPAVSESAGAVLDGMAYTAGDLGFNNRAFVRFNPSTNNFMRLTDLPASRNHAMMAAHGGHIYVFGGFDLDFVANDQVWRYDPARDRWATRDPMPNTLSAGTAVTLGDFIYVINRAGTIRRLDPALGEWTSFAGPGTEFRDHAGAVAYRGEIWWMAGRGFTGSHRSIDIFDPVTWVWRPGPSLLHAHSGFAAAVVDGQIMVAGGEHPGATLADWTLEQSLEIYSAQVGRWFKGPDIPVPVHGVVGASLNGRFYLFGGSVVAGTTGNPGIAQVYVPGD